MSRQHFFIKPKFQIRQLLKTLFMVAITTVILYVFLRNELAANLRLVVSDAEIVRILSISTKTFIVVSLILLIAFGMISLFTTHGMAGAVFSLERAIKNLGDGNFKTVVEVRKTDEFKELVVYLQKMTGKLRNAVYEDRQKAAEVKHLLLKLSETLDKKGSAGNARSIINEIDEKLSSMTSYFKI